MEKWYSPEQFANLGATVEALKAAYLDLRAVLLLGA
jgi:hypothetical protein